MTRKINKPLSEEEEREARKAIESLVVRRTSKGTKRKIHLPHPNEKTDPLCLRNSKNWDGKEKETIPVGFWEFCCDCSGLWRDGGWHE